MRRLSHPPAFASRHADNVEYNDLSAAWDEIAYLELGALFASLGKSLTENITFFAANPDASESLLQTLRRVRTVVWVVEPMALQVGRIAAEYDFPGIRGNGFRSLLSLVQICLRTLHAVSEDCRRSRESIFSRHSTVRRDLIDHGVSVLDNLIYRLLETSLSLHAPGQSNLFASTRSFEEVFGDIQCIDQIAILGRFASPIPSISLMPSHSVAAFQFPSDMRQFFKVLDATKASYSTTYESRSTLRKTLTTAAHTSRFLLSDRHRATQLAGNTRHAGVEFTKAFWNLAESTVVRTISNVWSPRSF